ncbi:DUF2017 domain-containing protein [Longivirga aurantiaca]|uniref:DUF2017 domain-containing protein n=1 Tax=Longivirga aurantiaca TaxID=1837743 RepID=A0ABW1T5A6_9ACTN
MAVHGFRRTATGKLVLKVDDVERGLLATLVSQVLELVSPEDDPWGADADPLARMVGIDPDAERPDDPALARLLPDAYADDDEASSEFRRFTERSLRETKMNHAATVLRALAEADRKVVVPDDEIASWMGALNDLRLALGARLGLTEDNHEGFYDLDEDDPGFVHVHVYDWLTFLQETLVQAVTGLTSEPPPGWDEQD